MQDRDNSLVVLIQRLETIKVNGDPQAEVRAIREKCDKAFLPFAESEIEFIDRDNLDEADAHIIALHEAAFTLRADCDNLLRSNALEESALSTAATTIIEAFVDCRARIENIYILRVPELLEAVDAVL
ncbi:MAG TPA: hypothetical protein VGQ12_07830 [Candidatus Angelobacter sp.]|jgi:hypothetical protein|nr:hypothetical protein [Candidatus Angelobacter sp.]